MHEPLARKRFKSPSLKWVSSHRAYVQMKSSQTGLIAQPKTTKYPQPLKHPQIKEKTARPDMREKVTDSNCSWTKMCSVKQRMELYVSNLIQQLETAVGECRFSPVTPEMCWKKTHIPHWDHVEIPCTISACWRAVSVCDCLWAWERLLLTVCINLFLQARLAGKSGLLTSLICFASRQVTLTM